MTSSVTTSGWTARLNELLDALRMRPYGRQADLARWTGLTAAGIKRSLDRDTPPRDQALESLSEALSNEFTSAGRSISAQQIKAFLLDRAPSPLIPVRQPPPVPPPATERALSVQEIGPALLFVHQFASRIGMNLFTDIPGDVADTIIQRVNSVAAQGIPLDSPAMAQVVQLFLDRARRNEPI